MTRRRAVPFTAVAAAAALVLAACEVDPDTDDSVLDPDPEADAGITDDEVADELEAPDDTTIVGEDALTEIDGDTATIVVEIRNDDTDRGVSTTAPQWDGNDAFEVLDSGIVPPDVLLEDGLEVPADAGALEDAVQLGPLESGGFTLQVAVDCDTEVAGDASFEVDTADGEVRVFAFGDLDALTAGPEGTWAEQLQAEICDTDDA